MSENTNKIMRFLGELQRRRTFRVSAAYVVVAWVLIEVSSVVLPAFGAADWLLPTFIIVIVAGLPVAIILSWIFDITPEGLRRTDDLDREESSELADVPEEIKPSIAVPLGSAERRQVSVLRCTFRLTLNGNIVTDPEVILAAMPELNGLVQTTAERFSAYLHDESGPVFELLFGYPVAFENDAVRAVAAAFAIRKEAGNLAIQTSSNAVLGVTCSVAVHSDLVVIEDPDADHDAATVVGNSSLVAGWLQSIAPTDAVGISESTRVLLRDAIRCESLGEFINPQTGESTEVHRAIQLISPKEALAAPTLAHGRFLGRESELALALNRWDDVLDGDDQFIVLRGEPGIGKSTLVKAIVDKVSETENAQLMPLYCSPFESSNPFHPIIEFFFGPGLELSDTESDAHKFGRVSKLLKDLGMDEERAGPLMAALLDVDRAGDGPGREHRHAESMRSELLQFLLNLFQAAAKRGPICVIFEDIHWADPSTLEFISMLVNRESRSGALCVFTTRPSITLEWEYRSNVTTLDLQRLSRRVTKSLVRDLLDSPAVDDNLIDSIVEETGGNPLFVEELSKAVAESITADDFVLEENLVLPGTVQQSLNARMDRLGDAKSVLQLCALLGRRFDYSLLIAVSETENESALQDDLQKIVNAEFLYQEGAIPNSIYRFKHVLMQETAANSLLQSTRVELHAHVANVIETEFPERAERNPALLGYHYAEGGQAQKSIGYWMAACKKSLEVFAMREAVDRAQSGLDTLQQLPHSQDRDAAEIMLRSMLGKGLLSLHGYADASVEENFSKAVMLSEMMEGEPDFLIVVGLWMYFFIGGEARYALTIAQRLVHIADIDSSPAKFLQAHYCVGYTLYRLGRYEEARQEFERALSFDTSGCDFSSVSATGDDTRMHVHAIYASVLWHLGDDEGSLEHIDRALEMSAEESNPVGQAFAPFQRAFLALFRRQPREAEGPAAHVVAVAEDKGLRFWLVIGSFMSAWASLDGGRSGSSKDKAERVKKLELTLEAYLSAGAVMGSTALGLQIGEDLIAIGDLDAAETWLHRVKSIIETTSERNFEPDVARIEGRLAAARGNADAAESLFEQAESLASEMGSVALTNRAVADYAEIRGSATTVQEAR